MSSETQNQQQQGPPTYAGSADDFLDALDRADNRRAVAAAREQEQRDSDGEEDDEEDEQYDTLRKKNIEEDTRDGYHGCMKRLVVWLFNNLPEALDHKCISALEDIRIMDTDDKNKQTMMNKASLDLIKSARTDFHPIIFSKMTVKIFIEFLLSLTKNKNEKYLSKSGYGTYRSALMGLYDQCGIEMAPQAYKEELKHMSKCLNKSYQKEKKITGGRMVEGKGDPMEFSLYNKLCGWMLADKGHTSTFAHAFLTMTWNLVCRSKNTIYIHRNHITWSEDSLCVQFAHMKTDMEGFESSVKRHIYSNPHNISICAVTALAKYLLFCPKRDDAMLFDKKSYQRFRKYLMDLVKKHEEELRKMGIDPKYIGVHSIRKGAATYCCSGTTAAPHIAAICNRAGWTMGRVLRIHIST
jgi:hypothetical protein